MAIGVIPPLATGKIWTIFFCFPCFESYHSLAKQVLDCIGRGWLAIDDSLFDCWGCYSDFEVVIWPLRTRSSSLLFQVAISSSNGSNTEYCNLID